MPRYLEIKDKSALVSGISPSRPRLDRLVKSILWTMFAGFLGMALLGIVFFI